MSIDTEQNPKHDDSFNITFLRIRIRNTNTVTETKIGRFSITEIN